MRSDDSTNGQTFLEVARRKQIVECAIGVLAREGFGRASLSRVAERAGVSKGVIMYHFAGKDALLEQVVSEVFRAATETVRPRVDAEETAAGKLRAYLRARIGFLGTHREHMLALFEIWMNFRDANGKLRLGESDAESTVKAIEEILYAGQRSGEFGAFATSVMAMSIRQAVDGVLLQLRTKPDLDLDLYTRELESLFDRATSPTTRRSR